MLNIYIDAILTGFRTLLETPVLQILFLVFLLFIFGSVFCLSLLMLLGAILDREHSIESRLGGFFFGSMFAVVMATHFNHYFLELRGLIAIGSKPDSGCYQPNFEQRKWLPIVCPPPSKSNL
jgi:hypothetical protein